MEHGNRVIGFEDFDFLKLLGESLIDLGGIGLWNLLLHCTLCMFTPSSLISAVAACWSIYKKKHPFPCLLLFQTLAQYRTSVLVRASAKNPTSSYDLSISLFLSFSLSYIISPKTKERPTANLTSSNQNIASDGIHPLRAKLHNDLQQLPRDLAILLLQRLPRLRRKQPSNAIQLRDDTTRALRAAEKGQLATRRARHNALVVVALLEVVLGAQDPGLQQVEAVGGVAARVQHLAAREDAAGQVGHDAEPEVFGAGGEVLEGLEEEREGLLEVAPFGGGRGRGFGDCCGGGAMQELAAGGADHLVEGRD
jgi:hypothetical protein